MQKRMLTARHTPLKYNMTDFHINSILSINLDDTRKIFDEERSKKNRGMTPGFFVSDLIRLSDEYAL